MPVRGEVRIAAAGPSTARRPRGRRRVGRATTRASTSWKWSAGVGAARGRPQGRLEPGQRDQRPARAQRAGDLGRRAAHRARARRASRGSSRSTSRTSRGSTSRPRPSAPITRAFRCWPARTTRRPSAPSRVAHRAAESTSGARGDGGARCRLVSRRRLVAEPRQWREVAMAPTAASARCSSPIAPPRSTYYGFLSLFPALIVAVAAARAARRATRRPTRASSTPSAMRPRAPRSTRSTARCATRSRTAETPAACSGSVCCSRLLFGLGRDRRRDPLPRGDQRRAGRRGPSCAATSTRLWLTWR